MSGNLKKYLNLGVLYQNLYDFLCGTHPNYRPWHFQWHFTKDTHKWQKKAMKNLSGRVLDVGCGNKPYKKWLDFEKVSEYVGIDVLDSKEVDVLITPLKKWPLEDESFDCIVTTQVLEHVENLEDILGQTKRVLKPGGRLLVTVPFLYPVHGEPFDFRRFTTYGINKILEPDYDILEIRSIGRLGSVLASMLLTGIENNLNYSFFTRLLKGIILPVWLPFCFLINVLCQIINYVGTQGTHYCNVCLVAKRK
ncbi:MAG: class I SAM-dependent methyltransferase [Alphaproteobacteria bacterium]|nr:class I SAM-dependent methyltransferase [Candidatus Parcubacteria bacterium]NCQ67531.1 class I SAM-dependent methyltransferase [Alphaproteobacteria bacterium]